MVAVVVLLGVVAAVSGGGSDRVIVGAAQEAPTAPATPFDGNDFTAVGVAGDEVFAYGGIDERGTITGATALIDPRSGEVTSLPEVPIDGVLQPPVAVGAAEGEVVLLGLLCADPQPDVELCAPATPTALSYDLAGGRWTALELPDDLFDGVFDREVLGNLSSGEVVFWLHDATRSALWALDPDSHRWSRLVDPGVRVDDACLAGDDVVVSTSRFRLHGEVTDRSPIEDLQPGERLGLGDADGYVEPSVLVLRGGSEGRWERSSVDEGYTADTDPAQVSCMGDRVMVHDLVGDHRSVHALADGAATGWSETPPAPADGTYTQQVWTGDELVFLNASPAELPTAAPAIAFDPDRSSWRTLEGAPLASTSTVWDGSALVGYAEFADTPGLGADYHFVNFEGI
jgi:hypothetical protein